MAMLDQSAAFDLVDYDILLKRLLHTFGISGSSLSWFTSFLSQRTQVVRHQGELSTHKTLDCRVPHCSSLGPLLFSLYVTDLHSVASSHDVNPHSYADDIQLCAHTKIENIQLAIDNYNLSTSINNKNTWMSSNSLKLNPDKT